jgi:hypothetical protein
MDSDFSQRRFKGWPRYVNAYLGSLEVIVRSPGGSVQLKRIVARLETQEPRRPLVAIIANITRHLSLSVSYPITALNFGTKQWSCHTCHFLYFRLCTFSTGRPKTKTQNSERINIPLPIATSPIEQTKPPGCSFGHCPLFYRIMQEED